MPVKRVDYFSETLIDISDSTITPEKVLKGEIGYNKAGTRFVGTAESGGGTGENNVVIVDFNILLNGGFKDLTDEEMLNLTSENNLVLIRNTFQQNIKVYFYKANENADDVFGDIENRIVFLSPATFLKDYNATIIFEIIINKKNKRATLNINRSFFVPVPQIDSEGKFLKIVDGSPTWTDLPIYNGEVE